LLADQKWSRKSVLHVGHRHPGVVEVAPIPHENPIASIETIVAAGPVAPLGEGVVANRISPGPVASAVPFVVGDGTGAGAVGTAAHAAAFILVGGTQKVRNDRQRD